MALFLSNGQRLTWEEARGEEINVLHKLRRSTKSSRLRDQLWLQKSQIQTIVVWHLGLRSSSQCNIFSPNTWNRGHFNICVNVQAQITITKLLEWFFAAQCLTNLAFKKR